MHAKTKASWKTKEQQNEAHLNELIKKSRTEPLTDAEKAQIKAILHLKNKKLLDQRSA